MAKQLLTDTPMTVTEVAFAAGFQSLRRFNAAFKTHYRLAPTSLRKQVSQTLKNGEDAYGFDLAVRSPFELTPFLDYWRRRGIPRVECVSVARYRRTVLLGGCTGWLGIDPGRKPHTIRVLVSTSLGPVLPRVLTRVKAMLDLRADPVEIVKRFSGDPLLATHLVSRPWLRVPGAFDGFECGIRTILGQQVSVLAATTIAGRMAQRFGVVDAALPDGVTTYFPTPETLANAGVEQLRSLGLTSRRAETVRAFAKAVHDGSVRLEHGADPDRTRAQLVALPGIGDWTAEYILMRAVGWPDGFPSGDLGLVKASGLTSKELHARSDCWRPWRSYAAILLWMSLSTAESQDLKGKTA
jgi:AraC family transcriptional regulator of adaptative response / DNA-3-methyladenine glycosylase II